MSEEFLTQPDVQTAFQRRSLITQIAITVFVGIPMTVALGLALVVYFTYEFAKMRITGKPPMEFVPANEAQQEVDVVDSPSMAREASFSNALANLSKVHGPTRTVITQGTAAMADMNVSQNQNSEVKQVS